MAIKFPEKKTEVTELTEEQFGELTSIVTETIDKLVILADKHKFKRDEFLSHFAYSFVLMVESATFDHYKKGEK